jgi:glycine/D-amino acid oxidase-like deaminating enzyme
MPFSWPWTGAKLVPVGPPNRYEEVASHQNVIVWVCRPRVDARGVALPSLDHRVKLGGMNEFHAADSSPSRRWSPFREEGDSKRECARAHVPPEARLDSHQAGACPLRIGASSIGHLEEYLLMV